MNDSFDVIVLGLCLLPLHILPMIGIVNGVDSETKSLTFAEQIVPKSQDWVNHFNIQPREVLTPGRE